MDTRKLIQFGKNSHVISLPKHWLEAHHLKKGADVYLEEQGGNLVVLPGSGTAEELHASITFHEDNFKVFLTELIGFYKAGCTTIAIEGKGLAKQLDDVRETIHNLVGMEIVEQSRTRMVVKDLIDVRQVALATLVTRMDMMIRSMFEDVASKTVVPDLELRSRDKDINRLQFLITRVIRKLLRNPALGNVLGVPAEEAYYIDRLTWALERIGDYLKRLNTDMLRIDGSKKKDLLKWVALLEEQYLQAMKVYGKRDIKKALPLHYTIQQQQVTMTGEVLTSKTHDELLARENLKNITRELLVVVRTAVELAQREAITSHKK